MAYLHLVESISNFGQSLKNQDQWLQQHCNRIHITLKALKHVITSIQCTRGRHMLYSNVRSDPEMIKTTFEYIASDADAGLFIINLSDGIILHQHTVNIACMHKTNDQIHIKTKLTMWNNLPALWADSADRAATAPSMPPVAVSSCSQ